MSLGLQLLALLSFAGLANAVELAACEVEGIAARCGQLELPENPSTSGGRTLSLAIVVLPATGGTALPDPIVPLMGGPGEDAISAAAIFAEQFEGLRRDRDILLVDQRGTGRSGALRCELFSENDPATSLRDLFPVQAVDRCARSLSGRADLTQYTYPHFAKDLEQVRRALGYGPLNLSAGSYGTRAAQVYLRAYPRSVRTVYFGSVIPMDFAMPLPMAKSAEEGLEKTFEACATQPACKAAFPKLREEFRQIVARLDTGTVRVALPGGKGPATLHRGRVVEWLRSQLYRPGTTAAVPWTIHRAFVGDWTPFVDGILANARGADSAHSFGLLLSTTCNEDVAFVREEDIVAQTRGTFLGDYRVRQQQAACAHWPKASIPAGHRVPVRSAIPAMFVSGDMDAGTPLWFTARAAAGFSNRIEIVHRGYGHTEWSDCVGRIYEKFVRSGTVRGLDASCKPLPRPPFRT
jgi:pimeloyl-ACP methyl ester carboxylesterase